MKAGIPPPRLVHRLVGLEDRPWPIGVSGVRSVLVQASSGSCRPVAGIPHRPRCQPHPDRSGTCGRSGSPSRRHGAQLLDTWFTSEEQETAFIALLEAVQAEAASNQDVISELPSATSDLIVAEFSLHGKLRLPAAGLARKHGLHGLSLAIVRPLVDKEAQRDDAFAIFTGPDVALKLCDADDVQPVEPHRVR